MYCTIYDQVADQSNNEAQVQSTGFLTNLGKKLGKKVRGVLVATTLLGGVPMDNANAHPHDCQALGNGQVTEERLVAQGLQEQVKDNAEILSIKDFEQVFEKLGNVLGIKIEFPQDEKDRLNGLRPQLLSADQFGKVKEIQGMTKGDRKPFIIQIPAKWVVDGVEQPFTLRNFAEVVNKAKEKGSGSQGMWISKYITNQTLDHVSSGTLRLFTPDALEGSKSKTWSEQMNIIERATGTKRLDQENAGVFIAGMLNNILTGERLLRDDTIRIAVNDRDGDPLGVFSPGVDFLLDGANRIANSIIGVGVSLDFPKR